MLRVASPCLNLLSLNLSCRLSVNCDRDVVIAIESKAGYFLKANLIDPHTSHGYYNQPAGLSECYKIPQTQPLQSSQPVLEKCNWPEICHSPPSAGTHDDSLTATYQLNWASFYHIGNSLSASPLANKHVNKYLTQSNTIKYNTNYNIVELNMLNIAWVPSLSIKLGGLINHRH